MRTDAITAANRFGLGARSADISRIGSDPRGWLHEQLDAQAGTPELLSRYPDSASILLDLFESRNDPQTRKATRKRYRKLFRQELSDRLKVAISTSQPLTERLVLFWSNHFTVSSQKGITGPTAGAFEREAVRPNIFGDRKSVV